MRQAVETIVQATRGQGFYDVTPAVSAWGAGEGFETGLLTLFCRHTSASLLVTENASPAVRRDLGRFLARLAPESESYEHDDEGPDDMPAHLRSIVTQTSLSVPVSQSRPMLGTWQGLYLAEHRASPHRRRIALHCIGV